LLFQLLRGLCSFFRQCEVLFAQRVIGFGKPVQFVFLIG
jgi:hypothetical protein